MSAQVVSTDNTIGRYAGGQDERDLVDRRRRPTPFLSRYSFVAGRRSTLRRHSDKRRVLFLDHYHPRLFSALIFLLLLCLLDSYFTLFLTSHGMANEMNPIMAFYLNMGAFHFITVKYLFSSVSIFIFCLLHHFPIVRASLTASILVYFGIVAYEVAFIRHIFST